MSVQAITWAFARQDVEVNNSTSKFILVALANDANSYGITFVGQALIAERCGVVVETVSRNMASLEESGLIRRVQRRRGNGSRTSDWTVLAPNWRDRGALEDAPVEEFPDDVVQLATQRSLDFASPDVDPGRHLTLTGGPEPLVEPSVSGEGARTRGRAVKYNGRKVSVVMVDNAELLLSLYNAETGRKIGARTAGGQPSPDCKQIIGALLARPDVTMEDWGRAVRNTVANPPGWCDGRKVQIGDVFGERAAGHALANDGKAQRNVKNGVRREPSAETKAKYAGSGW